MLKGVCFVNDDFFLFASLHLCSRSGSVFQFEGMMNQAQSPTNTSPSRQSSTSGQSKFLLSFLFVTHFDWFLLIVYWRADA